MADRRTSPGRPLWAALSALSRGELVVVAAAVGFSIVAGAAAAASPDSTATFVAAGVALAAQAALVGQSIEQVGKRVGPGATGLLQSALGNLPELFVGIFALQAGLIDVVRAALIGSILASTLLVLGLAFLAGGLRHGTQRFPSEAPRMICTLLLLSVAALLVPTLAARLGTPAGAHEGALSDACAVLLVVVYVTSIPFWLRGDTLTGSDDQGRAGAAERPVAVRPGCRPARPRQPRCRLRLGLVRRGARAGDPCARPVDHLHRPGHRGGGQQRRRERQRGPVRAQGPT